MKELFAQISDMTPTLHGWASVEKACTLAGMVIALRPEVTVEIGVWGGRSLLPMALAHKMLGKGLVYAVDPWHPGISAEGQMDANLDWWRKQDHEAMFQYFNKKVRELGVQNVVKVHRMKSDDFDPPRVIDLWHSDGNHSAQAIKDVKKFAPRIRIGGIAVLDDLEWQGGAVAASAQTLMFMGFERLYTVKHDSDNWAVFQRTR